MTYFYLSMAILSEVIATSSIKLTEGFTKIIPSIVVIFGYLVSFYFFALAIRALPLGIAYAIWSGLGIFLVTIVGVLFYNEYLDFPAIAGTILIIASINLIAISIVTPAIVIPTLFMKRIKTFINNHHDCNHHEKKVNILAPKRSCK